MNSSNFKNKKSAVCHKCNLNSGIKKYKFICKGNIKLFLCVFCIEKLGGPPTALSWLNKHSDFYFNKKKSQALGSVE